ncbi:MAG: hypothetical protein FWE53_01675 [Firmicutes bacterium]|nr:hypothetical protein [Bacillota bacterium]
MPVITLICPQCGGQVGLDDSKEIGFCNHCGTKMIIKDEITNNTYNTTHNVTRSTNVKQNITKVIHGNVYGAEADKTTEELMADGYRLLKTDRTKGLEKFWQAVEADPDNYHTWLTYARVSDERDDKRCSPYYNSTPVKELKKAWELADGAGREEMREDIIAGIETCRKDEGYCYQKQEPKFWESQAKSCPQNCYIQLAIELGGEIGVVGLRAKIEKLIACSKTLAGYEAQRFFYDEIEREHEKIKALNTDAKIKEEFEKFRNKMWNERFDEFIENEIDGGSLSRLSHVDISDKDLYFYHVDFYKKAAERMLEARPDDYRSHLFMAKVFCSNNKYWKEIYGILSIKHKDAEEAEAAVLRAYDMADEEGKELVNRFIDENPGIDNPIAAREAGKREDDLKSSLSKLVEEYKEIIQSGNAKAEKQFFSRNSSFMATQFGIKRIKESQKAAQKFAKVANRGGVDWDLFASVILQYWK